MGQFWPIFPKMGIKPRPRKNSKGIFFLGLGFSPKNRQNGDFWGPFFKNFWKMGKMTHFSAWRCFEKWPFSPKNGSFLGDLPMKVSGFETFKSFGQTQIFETPKIAECFSKFFGTWGSHFFGKLYASLGIWDPQNPENRRFSGFWGEND